VGRRGEGEERPPDFCSYTTRIPCTVGGFGGGVFLVYMLNGTKVEGRGPLTGSGEWGVGDEMGECRVVVSFSFLFILPVISCRVGLFGGERQTSFSFSFVKRDGNSFA